MEIQEDDGWACIITVSALTAQGMMDTHVASLCTHLCTLLSRKPTCIVRVKTHMYKYLPKLTCRNTVRLHHIMVTEPEEERRQVYTSNYKVEYRYTKDMRSGWLEHIVE